MSDLCTARLRGGIAVFLPSRVVPGRAGILVLGCSKEGLCGNYAADALWHVLPGEGRAGCVSFWCVACEECVAGWELREVGIRYLGNV